MWRQKRRAAEARAKLEAYSEEIRRYETLKDQVEHFTGHPYQGGGDAAKRERAETLRVAQHHLLLRQAAEIKRLTQAVHIHEFNERGPQGHLNSVQRAIGSYADIEAGAKWPKPPPKETPKVSSSGPAWWLTLLLAAIGSGGSYFAAYYSTRQTCLPRGEVVCTPIDGEPYGAQCNEDGDGQDGPCKPLRELRRVGRATPTPPAPTPISVPATAVALPPAASAAPPP